MIDASRGTLAPPSTADWGGCDHPALASPTTAAPAIATMFRQLLWKRTTASLTF
jgi:hypothetical protein